MEYTTDISCFSYACSSCGEELVNKLKHTNKLLLPQSVLYSLQEDGDEFESPLFFKLKNKSNEFYQVCGVPLIFCSTRCYSRTILCYEYVRY